VHNLKAHEIDILLRKEVGQALRAAGKERQALSQSLLALRRDVVRRFQSGDCRGSDAVACYRAEALLAIRLQKGNATSSSLEAVAQQQEDAPSCVGYTSYCWEKVQGSVTNASTDEDAQRSDSAWSETSGTD
jgi:hypothetical protein